MIAGCSNSLSSVEWIEIRFGPVKLSAPPHPSVGSEELRSRWLEIPEGSTSQEPAELPRLHLRETRPMVTRGTLCTESCPQNPQSLLVVRCLSLDPCLPPSPCSSPVQAALYLKSENRRPWPWVISLPFLSVLPLLLPLLLSFTLHTLYIDSPLLSFTLLFRSL